MTIGSTGYKKRHYPQHLSPEDYTREETYALTRHR